MVDNRDETERKEETVATEENQTAVTDVAPEAEHGGDDDHSNESQDETSAPTDDSSADVAPPSDQAADEGEADQPAPESDEAPSDDTPSDDAVLAEYDETFVTLTPGQIIDGKVVQVSSDEVMVDVGYKSEGRIPLNEIGLSQGQTPEEAVAVGDDIEVYVLKVDDTEGNVLLSKRRADQRAAWERLDAAHEGNEVIEAKVTERVKGGLLADVGVRGFIPASHVSRNYVENLDEYVGQTLRLKVIEIDKQKNNVVLSHKDVLEEEYEAAKAETFEKLEAGAIVDGVVKRITDFGAFVDIGGGVEGLLHVSEMAWSRVSHPSDVVSEGQTFPVKVLKVDQDKERISLSLKETLPDPWDSVLERYEVGTIVPGVVTRVVDFGAFIKLEDGVEGLVHVSQLADYHVEQPSEVVQPGAEVSVRIVSVDQERRRIGLSMRAPEAERPAAPRGRQKSQPREEPRTTSGDSTSVTLGDMFGDLGSFFDNDSDK